MNTLRLVLSVERQPPQEGRNDMSQLRVLHLESNGELRVTESWLRKLLRIDLETILGKYGSQGVELLAAAKEVGVKVGSKATKAEIIEAIEKASEE